MHQGAFVGPTFLPNTANRAPLSSRNPFLKRILKFIDNYCLALSTWSDAYVYTDEQRRPTDTHAKRRLYVLLTNVSHGRSTYSSARLQLCISTVGDTAFPVAAARLWNSLPISIARHCCGAASSAVALNHISSHFLIPLSDSSLICTVPAQWLIIWTLQSLLHLTFNMTPLEYGCNSIDYHLELHGRSIVISFFLFLTKNDMSAPGLLVLTWVVSPVCIIFLYIYISISNEFIFLLSLCFKYSGFTPIYAATDQTKVCRAFQL